MTRHPSTLTLHRLRYGELDDATASDVRSHVEVCEVCGPRLAAQQNLRAEFELRPVPDALRGLSVPEAANRPRRWLRWLAAAAAAAVVLIAVPVAVQQVGIDGVEVTTAKGSGVDVEVWLSTPDGPRALKDGDEVAAGDRIQVRFRRPTHPWVTLAGVDARGTAEVYGTWTAAMDSVEWQTSPFALELDDTPGRQELYLISSARRPAESSVVLALEGGPTPGDWDVRGLRLEKPR